MRFLNYSKRVIILFFFIAFINSCEDEGLQPELTDLEPEVVHPLDIGVTANKVLFFKDLKSFLDTRNLVSMLSEAELQNWKLRFKGFESLSDVLDEFTDHLSIKYLREFEEDPSNYAEDDVHTFYSREIAKSKYRDLYHLDEGSFQINLFDPVLSHLVDINRAVKIGPLFYVFDLENIRVMKSGDYNLLDEAKHVQESNALVDVYPAEQVNNSIANSSAISQSSAPPIPSLGSGSTFSQSAQWTTFFSPEGAVKAKITANRWGFPIYELVSPCPDEDPFGGISLECEVFTGEYAWLTSAFIEAWTTKIKNFLGVPYPDQVSRSLRVIGRFSFPTIGLHNIPFDHVLITHSSGPAPDFNPAYKRLDIHSYSGWSSVTNFEATVTFVPPSSPVSLPTVILNANQELFIGIASH